MHVRDVHEAHPLLVLQHVLVHQVLLLEQQLLLLLQRRLLLRHIPGRQPHPGWRTSSRPRISWRRLHSSRLSRLMLACFQPQQLSVQACHGWFQHLKRRPQSSAGYQ